MSAVLVWLLSLAATATPDIASLSEALRRPEISGPALTEESSRYTFGRLELDLSTGERYPISVDGRRIGLFFTGKGRFHYRADDPRTSESFALNVKRTTSLAVEDGTLSGSLETALLLDSGLPARATLSAEVSAVPEDAARRFERHLDRFADDRQLILPNLFAQALIEPEAGPVVAVQMQAGRDDLLFVHDGLRNDEAGLLSMQRFPDSSALRGSRFPEFLTSRPLSEDWLRWDKPRFTLRAVDFALVSPEGPGMTIEIEERFEVHEMLETLELTLWSEVFKLRQSFSYDLTSVTLEGGTELPFSHRWGDLVVQLPEPVAAGSDLLLRFRLSGDVLHRPSGNSYWWLPLGAWLPLPPRFDARSYTVHGNIEVEDPFIPFAMGRTIRRWQEGNFHGLEFEVAEPIQFAVVLAGDYHSYTEMRGGQTITLSSYAFSQDEPMRVIANNVFELIDYYEEMLGDFPYPELNILEINAFGFGIAPPGVIYLTREGFDPGPTGRSFRKEINRRMAHEVGHMWWGHVAQMASPDDQWLSESISEYLAAVALEDLVGRNSMKKALREWRAETANSKRVTSIYMANRLSGERAGYDRRNLLYSRGPLLFQALREEIGDEAFFALVRRFANDTRFEHITTLDFLELTNEVTRENYIEWFERELFGLE